MTVLSTLTFFFNKQAVLRECDSPTVKRCHSILKGTCIFFGFRTYKLYGLILL